VKRKAKAQLIAGLTLRGRHPCGCFSASVQKAAPTAVADPVSTQRHLQHRNTTTVDVSFDGPGLCTCIRRQGWTRVCCVTAGKMQHLLVAYVTLSFQ
jgi:hypothetical protein